LDFAAKNLSVTNSITISPARPVATPVNFLAAFMTKAPESLEDDGFPVLASVRASFLCCDASKTEPTRRDDEEDDDEDDDDDDDEDDEDDDDDDDDEDDDDDDDEDDDEDDDDDERE